MTEALDTFEDLVTDYLVTEVEVRRLRDEVDYLKDQFKRVLDYWEEHRR